MVLVLKLGGSVVTDKGSPETVDEEALAAAAAAIGTYGDDLVLVHGGGSFGHHQADRHGVTDARGTSVATAVTDIHGSMRALNRAVVADLQAEAVDAVPVSPLSVACRRRDGHLEFPAGSVSTLLGEGFVPVLHGDVVAQAGAGATILSGDEIVVTLARSLDAERVGLCSGVPGVLDDEGAVIQRIDTYDTVAAVLGESDATDVTGGMAGKVRALLDLDSPAHVFGPDDLEAFLEGGSPGTEIRGG